jgi:hypothetical protein
MHDGYPPLIKARDKGYGVGIIHATRMGYPVYAHPEFKQHCILTSYEWRPKEKAAENY